jgi:large subunit ribosomal protein L5e
LVVRFTNTSVICQLIYAKIQGDIIVTAAYSNELKKYGVPVGLTNYAAAYCTGLLCARRALTKLGLDKTEFNAEEGPRQFKANLDIGLARTSSGAKIFGAMKGAVDGGLDIPHSSKRLPGYDKEKDECDGQVLRKYIFGGHVADYMRSLEEEDEEEFKKHFSRFVKAGITADKIEEMYTKAHAAIRADPLSKKSKVDYVKLKESGLKHKKARLNLKQRKDRVHQKIESFNKRNEMEA